MFREAKRQNVILKTELERKTELWREWNEWWNTQRQIFRVKSTSPAKQPNRPPQSVEPENDRQNGKVDSNIMNRRDVTLEKNNEVMTLEENFRTFSPDSCAARRDIQSIASPVASSIKPEPSVKRTKSSEQLSASQLNRSRSMKSTDHDNMEEIRQIQDILYSADLQDVQIASMQSGAIEILDIQESSVTNLHTF